MKLQTQTRIGKAAISSEKVTAGCVVQGIPNICRLTQLEAFYIRHVCTRPSLFYFAFLSVQ